MAAATGPAFKYQANPDVIRKILPDGETSNFLLPDKSVLTIKPIPVEILLEMHSQTENRKTLVNPLPAAVKKNYVSLRAPYGENKLLNILNVSISKIDISIGFINDATGAWEFSISLFNDSSQHSGLLCKNGSSFYFSRLPRTGSAPITGPAPKLPFLYE